MSLIAVADATGLHVRARGLARLWGWSAGIDVARADIAGASVQSWREVRSQLGWRIAGTSVPKRFTAGRFAIAGRQGERAWLYVDRRGPVLCVQTPPGRRPALVAIDVDRVDRRDGANWMP